MQGRKDFTPKLFYELSLDGLVPQDDFYRKVNKHVLMAALTYNLKKYLRFVVKKPSVLAQVISLKQGKGFTFLKATLIDFKTSILSHSNFRILNYN